MSPDQTPKAHPTMDADLESWPEDDCFTHETGREDTNEAGVGPYRDLSREKNEIRLVEVLPGNPQDPIRCRISSFALDEAPKYTALSYTWGRPDSDCSIELNGHLMPARKNMWRFLHQIRRLYAWRGIKFWIDAICIQQSNSQERNHQVGLMAQIYSGAAQVLVWLGPDYGFASAAFKALRNADKSSARMEKFWWKSGGAGLRRLCERRYWTRLWVVQELVLAREVILLCGASCLSWQALLEIVDVEVPQMPTSRQEAPPELESTMKSRAASMVAQTKRGRSTDSLYDQVLASAHLGCSEPRDKIFALLGIVRLKYERIVPDYTMDMSELLNAVLRSQHFHAKPKSLQQVQEQCRQLQKGVGTEPDLIFSLKDLEAGSMFDFKSFPIQDGKSGLSFWWAIVYRHEAVRRLWLRNNDHVALRVALSHASRLGEERLCRLLLEAWPLDIVDEGFASFGGHHRHPLIEAGSGGFSDIVTLLLGKFSRKPSSGLLEATFKSCLETGNIQTALAAFSTQLDIAPDDIEALSSLVRAAVAHHNAFLIQRGFEVAQRCSFTIDHIESFADNAIRYTIDMKSLLVSALLEGIRVLRNGARGRNNSTHWPSPEHDCGSLLKCFIHLESTEDALRMIERPDVDVNTRCDCRLCHSSRFNYPATPLELAISYYNQPVVVALLSRKDLEVGASIFQTAASNPHRERPNDWMKTEDYGEPIMAMLLRRLKLDLNSNIECFRASIEHAIVSRSPGLVKLLLQQKGNYISCKDLFPRRPLFLGVTAGTDEIERMLLDQMKLEAKPLAPLRQEEEDPDAMERQWRRYQRLGEIYGDIVFSQFSQMGP